MNCKLSIIVPVLNEADQISDLLQSLQSLRSSGHEIIVVDGGSTDGTLRSVRGSCDQLVVSAPGRAVQMNLGAVNASGDMLIFLHADTRLPVELESEESEFPNSGWGFFPVSLSGEHWLLRYVEAGINWRSLVTGIASGDQAIFCSRELFDAVGGFPEIALMEDIELSARMKKLGRPQVLSSRVLTSSRRWESNGICRTVRTMWWLRFLYWLGCSPETIQRKYSALKNR